MPKLFLLSDHPERLLFVQQAGITAIVLPEFDQMLEVTQENPHHCANVGIHSLNTVKWIAKQEENADQKEMWNSAVIASGEYFLQFQNLIVLKNETLSKFLEHPLQIAL